MMPDIGELPYLESLDLSGASRIPMTKLFGRSPAGLTALQTDVVQRLTMNLMGEIEAASATVTATLQNALLGRVEMDLFRRIGLEQTAAMQAAGAGAYKALCAPGRPGLLPQRR